MSAQDIQKIQDAQHKVTDSAAQAKTQDSQLSSRGAGTDPDYAKTDERFASMTHEQIYNAVHGRPDGSGGMDAAGLHQMRQTWFEVGSDLENLSTFNLLGMNNIFNHGLWQGTSGNAAQAASERVAQAANQIGQVFTAVSQRLDSLAWAAEAIKLAVQPPPAGAATATPNPDNSAQSILPGLINPAYADQLETQRKAAREAAVHAMETLYTPSYPPAGAGVPSYTDVPQIDSTDPATAAEAIPGAPVAPGTAHPQQSADPSAHQPNSQNQQQSSPTATDSASSGMSAGTMPAGLSMPSSPSPAAATPAATTLAGFAPGTGTLGGVTSTDGSGLGGFAGSDSGPLTGGPGSSRSSEPSTSAPGGSARATTAGTAASTARMPMGSMPHAGKQDQDEEDEREHYSPDYLRGIQPDWDEGLESPTAVIGPDLIATGPSPHQQIEVEPAVRDMPRSTAETGDSTAVAFDQNPASPADTAQLFDDPLASVPTEPTQLPQASPELTSLFAEYGWATERTANPIQESAGRENTNTEQTTRGTER
ncbi:hypothetical protein [Nocardia jiangxiensis]|uniref:hypothetical protein n=1 Tax=Nocardia jiangxiensis TaxID=282685 RepID=UPI0003010086|nr:hypothetical protein [Nocardia jiangxiensis]